MKNEDKVYNKSTRGLDVVAGVYALRTGIDEPEAMRRVIEFFHVVGDSLEYTNVINIPDVMQIKKTSYYDRECFVPSFGEKIKVSPYNILYTKLRKKLKDHLKRGLPLLNPELGEQN